MPSDYPTSLERELASLLSRIATQGAQVDRLVAGAELYLNIADDLFDDETHKRLAYEAGAEMATRALQVDERNAQAHFLYAAALGSAERLKGIANAGLVLGEIKQHVRRAIELDPTHAQALQMMGGLYAELPWLLGGSEKEAESCPAASHRGGWSLHQRPSDSRPTPHQAGPHGRSSHSSSSRAPRRAPTLSLCLEAYIPT